MPATTLANVIVPEIWVPYMIKKTMEKSALIQSGVISNDKKMDELASQAGPVVNMPFWADLSGESENVTEGGNLTADGIVAKKDVAAIIRRAKMWSSTDLSAALSGDDPAKVIASLVADFWARDMQKEAIAILNGIFSKSASVTTEPGKALLLDISGEAGAKANISATGVIDAAQLLGDAKDQISTIAMHSATETALRKANLIQTIQPSDDISFGTYQGKRVIVDDGLPVDSTGKIFTTYLFGDGAFALGNGSPAGFVPAEVDRDKKKGSGVDYLINRKQYLLHARGFKFKNAHTADAGPSRADLANPGNYELVYEPKQVKVVALKHKIG